MTNHPHIRSRNFSCFAAGLIVVAVFGVFSQTFNDEFIAFDDRDYLANPIISQGFTVDGLRYAFTDTVVSHWNPVTVLSHMTMVQVFGLEPGPHHAANVLIHLASALLVYWTLFRMTGAAWPSLAVALLFAVHPLRAESVAWIAERKGLLSGFFGLLAVWAYVEYARKPTLVRYGLVAIAFALSLMSKAALLSLPIALLLLDYWPLRRFESAPKRGRLVLEKLPLLALSAGAAIVAYTITTRHGVLQSSDQLSFAVRMANALRSYFMYVVDTIVPVNLAPQYAHLGDAVFGPVLYAGALVLVAISIAAIVYSIRSPWFFVGWFWFLITLAPLVGIIQVANQGRADRYMYVPQIGLFMIAAWGIAAFIERRPRLALPLRVIAGIAIVADAILGFLQTHYWRDDFTLFTRAVAVNPESAMNHYGLGVAYLKQNDLEKAEVSFRRATELQPPVPEAFSNLGAMELQQGRIPQAVDLFEQAIAWKPNSAELWVNYYIGLTRAGRQVEAHDAFVRASQLDPFNVRVLEIQRKIEREIKQ